MSALTNPDPVAALLRTGTATTVAMLLDTFHRAAANADLNTYMGCFYSQEARFLGTDAQEDWLITEFYVYSKPHFDAGKAWTYTPRASSRKITELVCGGSVPRIAAFDELLDSESFVCTTRGTGTAIFDGSHWFLLSYHLSFPTPNDIAEDICKRIVVFEKKTATIAAAAKADAAAAALLAELELEEESVGAKQSSNSSKKKKGR
jgi:SnoaL-like domain